MKCYQKKKIKFAVMFLFGILFLNSVMAVQPTQQFNKIFLSPFYSDSMTQNVQKNFTININPPDKINSVISAIITFDIWLNPSVNFTLLVNNQPCNNPYYYVSTTYASAGKNMVNFDCSNVINQAGNYKVTLKSSKDTGALTGWLDLTYMNSPLGELKVAGTEYTAGDLATTFVQLIDNQGLPIQDGSCYLDVWYPSTINSTHPYTIKDAPMLKAEGDDGIYYYDMIAPSILGVYMLSAKCSYSFSGIWVYTLEGEEISKPIRNVTSGTYSGDTIFLNDFEDWVYTQCSSGGGKICDASYDFNTTIHYPNLNTSQITNIDLYYMGESSSKNTITFSVWNWTSNSWIILPNNLTFSGGASSVPIGIGDFSSNSLPIPNIVSTAGIIRIRTYTISGSTFYQFDNWLNMQIKSSSGIIQTLKGSGEMNVRNLPQATAVAVWNYTDRNLTYYPEINYTNVASSVWSWAGSISSSILGFFSNDIWNYATRTLTFYQDTTNYSQIAEYVWTYNNRNLTFYEVNDITPTDVWNYMSRNLTFYEVNNLTSSEIWNYADRNLSYYEDVTNYSQVAQYVWLYVDRNLTTYQINNISANDIWNYYNRSLTDDIPMQIWNYPNRNITTDIPFEVWNYYNRTLTYYTINLTELIDMINAYNFTDTPIFVFTPQGNQFQSYTLNVTLYVPY